MEMAKTIYETVCSTLDNMKINYKRHDDDLVITFGHKGDDMNHDLIIAVNAKQEVVKIIEQLPYNIDPSKAADVAMAVCYVNEQLLTGGFEYGMGDTLAYSVNHAYTGSLIGEETIKRLILALVFTVEEYDDKFMALNKGYIKPEDFKAQD